jgi:carboxypeptidase D
MRWISALSAFLLSEVVDAAGRSIGHAGKRHVEHAAGKRVRPVLPPSAPLIQEREVKAPRFLNANTTSRYCALCRASGTWLTRPRTSSEFAVDGTAIPDVDFDVGESYSGLLPISSDPNEESNLFFWFFPSTNPKAEKEIVIWLNGGVSVGSLFVH